MRFDASRLNAMMSSKAAEVNAVYRPQKILDDKVDNMSSVRAKGMGRGEGAHSFLTLVTPMKECPVDGLQETQSDYP